MSSVPQSYIMFRSLYIYSLIQHLLAQIKCMFWICIFILWHRYISVAFLIYRMTDEIKFFLNCNYLCQYSTGLRADGSYSCWMLSRAICRKKDVTGHHTLCNFQMVHSPLKSKQINKKQHLGLYGIDDTSRPAQLFCPVIDKAFSNPNIVNHIERVHIQHVGPVPLWCEQRNLWGGFIPSHDFLYGQFHRYPLYIRLENTHITLSVEN